MTHKRPQQRKDIDYVFSRYPLWIRYSGLPKEAGVVAWAVFQRILELRYRFDSVKFHYSLEKLCDTTGVSGRGAIRRVIKRLCDLELIRYLPSHGRGQEAQFELIEPLKTPIPEEDVYRTHRRLRPRSYNETNCNGSHGRENGSARSLLSDETENGSEGSLLDEIKRSERSLLEGKYGSERSLLGEKTDPSDPPLKRIYIKRQQQQKDPFHDGDRLKNADHHQPPDGQGVVVAFDKESLKEYGISGEQAARCLKRYAPHYLQEKIEIIEYKRYCGEQIRNIGGMLMKAIEEDWQAPEGFSTRAQREEMARREREAGEAAARAAQEKREQEKRDRDRADAAEEWKKTAPREVRESIRDLARREVMAEMPGIEERLLRVPVRLRENRIIAERYLTAVRDRGG